MCKCVFIGPPLAVAQLLAQHAVTAAAVLQAALLHEVRDDASGEGGPEGARCVCGVQRPLNSNFCKY